MYTMIQCVMGERSWARDGETHTEREREFSAGNVMDVSEIKV